MWRLFAAISLAGCGEVYFVDPNPPALEQSRARITMPIVDEPIVWLPVIDLFVESSSSCDGARAWTLGAIRAAFAKVGAPSAELSAQDLSPACTQPAGRAADVAAGLAGLQQARARFAGATVKLVIVYANNIALPLPASVVQSLSDLRQQSSGAIWTLSATQSAAIADQSVAWTYAFDPALQQAITTLAAAQLPFQSDSATPPPAQPLLAGDQLAKVSLLKICSADPGAQVQGAPAGGQAGPINAAQPPFFTVAYQRRLAAPHGVLVPLAWEVRVETCAAHCDRFYTGSPGDLRRWNDTPGCFLAGP